MTIISGKAYMTKHRWAELQHGKSCSHAYHMNQSHQQLCQPWSLYVVINSLFRRTATVKQQLDKHNTNTVAKHIRALIPETRP